MAVPALDPAGGCCLARLAVPLAVYWCKGFFVCAWGVIMSRRAGADDRAGFGGVAPSAGPVRFRRDRPFR